MVTSVLPHLLAQATGNAPPGGASDDSLLIWAIALIGVAIALFVVELFIPSGGIIGFLSAAALVGGIVLLFRVDTTVGLISAIVALVCLPFVIGFALSIWPNTWFAQLLTLKDAGRPGATVPGGAGPVGSGVKVGVRGKAATDLRPVGVCVIEGKRMECLAQTGLIEAGTEVEVVSVDGMQVKVRAVG